MFLQDHLENCSMIPLPCPNSCGDIIPREMVTAFHCSLSTGRPESQQPTKGSQIIRICMEIYLKINKMVKIYKNSY